MKADRIKRMLAPFRIYGAASTSVTKAFASAIAPVDAYDEERLGTMLRLLGQDPSADLFCVYCTSLATEWDHLESIVKQKEFNPPGQVIGNLVPACSRCNGQKGNKPWREFVAATVAPDRQAEVVARIEAVIDALIEPPGSSPTAISPQLRAELGAMRDEIHAIMRRADELIKAERRPLQASVAPKGVASSPGLDRFFDDVFDILEQHGVRRPTSRNRPYQSFSSGAFGSFWIWPTTRELRVVCYLGTTHRDAGDRALFNQELFSLLLADEDEIEADVGEELVWEALEGRQACWIGLTHDAVDLADHGQSQEAARWAAHAAARLLTALEDRARALAAELLAPKQPGDVGHTTPHGLGEADRRAWSDLAYRLARVIDRLPPGATALITSRAIVIETDDGRDLAGHAVQLELGSEREASVHAMNRCEQTLLGDESSQVLGDAGWVETSPEADGPWPMRWQASPGASTLDVAHQIVFALHDAFGADKADLRWLAWSEDKRSWAAPRLGIDADPHQADFFPGLCQPSERFEWLVSELLDDDVVHYTSAGDVVIAVDGLSIWVSVQDGLLPGLVMTAIVLPDVASDPWLIELLENVNEQSQSVKLFHIGSQVRARVDVPISLVDVDSLAALGSAVSQIVQQVRSIVAQRGET